MAGLWEKRGDRGNVPVGVGGRKITLGTQTNRNQTRAENRNQDSKNNKGQMKCAYMITFLSK